MSIQYFRFSGRRAFEPLRSPLLERLLARADDFTAVSDWRADAFRVIAPQASSVPGVAAASILADQGEIAGAWVCIATPVRYLAEMSNVRLAQDGILSLSPPEAESLAQDFNRIWLDSGVRLIAGGASVLYCIFDQELAAATSDPEDVLDRHIEAFLPAGRDSPRLRRLMSEMEMWLFEHGVNGARVAQGLPAVNGLWLWGGGAPVASLAPAQGFCAGDDLFFKAFGKGSGSGGAGVIAVSQAPGSEGWGQVESSWLKPAVEQLRSGRISRLELSAVNRCFTLTAGASRRFWRRGKPWWEFFA